MVRMNITTQDEAILKEVKRIVEKIEKSGTLPTDINGITELFKAWNLTYKKNEKVSNCPSCRPRKFANLKQTYDLFDLKNKYNEKKVVKVSLNPKPKQKPKRKKK
jgi:hypothetical protein